MKELNLIKKKDIPHKIKIRIAALTRDYNIEAEKLLNKGHDKFEYSLESFNNRNYFKPPDTIGITVFYPNKRNVTHMICGIYPSNIGEKGFFLQLQILIDKLKSKIGK